MKKARQGKVAAVCSSSPDLQTREVRGAKVSLPLESENCPAGLNDRWTVLGVCIFLAAITWLVFGQTLGHEFVNYDDNNYITDNPVGTRWPEPERNWLGVYPQRERQLDPADGDFSHARLPVVRTKAGGHHLTNVLLHIASVIMLFLVLKRMTAALWRSAFVAAVFAIHPLHVESVAWIAERKDVLSGLFFMLTLGAYASYVRHPRSLGRYLIVR